MASKVHARRYAQAVFEIALERKELDIWQSDLKKIAAFGKDAAISAVLESPRVSFEEKVILFSEWFKDINPMAMNLVHIMTAKGKFSMLSDIAEGYQSLLDSYRGISTAEVVTATPLSDEDEAKLAVRLSELSGKKITLKSAVNPALIGGIVARMDGKLLDGSTSSKLVALKNELAGVNR